MSKQDILLRFPTPVLESYPNLPRAKVALKFHKQYLALAEKIDQSELMGNREKFIALERLEESYMWYEKAMKLINYMDLDDGN